jgi:hypothetical protein
LVGGSMASAPDRHAKTVVRWRSAPPAGIDSISCEPSFLSV